MHIPKSLRPKVGRSSSYCWPGIIHSFLSQELLRSSLLEIWGRWLREHTDDYGYAAVDALTVIGFVRIAAMTFPNPLGAAHSVNDMTPHHLVVQRLPVLPE